MTTALSGQTIVITGAASGLGRAWARSFLEDGATVIAADIDPDGLATLEGARTIETDVAESDAVRAMIEFTLEQTGRVDALFNNAGVGFRRRIEDLRDDEFEQHVAIHLFGAVNGMRYAIPVMREQGYGRVINTVSRVAEMGQAKTSAYAAAKAGIWAATRAAAREVEDADILVNMLIPGPTNTAIWRRDMPHFQKPEATCPTARMLATLPAGGATGRVFWDEAEYRLFDRTNADV